MDFSAVVPGKFEKHEFAVEQVNVGVSFFKAVFGEFNSKEIEEEEWRQEIIKIVQGWN